VAAAAAAKLAFGFVIGRSQAGYSIGMCYMFGLFLVFLACAKYLKKANLFLFLLSYHIPYNAMQKLIKLSTETCEMQQQ